MMSWINQFTNLLSLSPSLPPLSLFPPSFLPLPSSLSLSVSPSLLPLSLSPPPLSLIFFQKEYIFLDIIEWDETGRDREFLGPWSPSHSSTTNESSLKIVNAWSDVSFDAYRITQQADQQFAFQKMRKMLDRKPRKSMDIKDKSVSFFKRMN